MPDLFSVIGKHWKLMLLLTLISTVVALVVCIVSPKQYLGTATALPANTYLADKARIFNQNIEALYTEFGTPDELDKLEGTAKLDTIYLAATKDFNLIAHYDINRNASDALEKAALKLRKNTAINRTGYGELKVKVWDRDNSTAANLANALLQKINDIHQALQAENNRTVLDKLREDYAAKQKALQSANATSPDTVAVSNEMQKTIVKSQLQQYGQLMTEYDLALKTNPKALLVVERARPSPWADKPATAQIVLFTFLASLLFSFLLGLYIEGRNKQFP